MDDSPACFAVKEGGGDYNIMALQYGTAQVVNLVLC